MRPLETKRLILRPIAPEDWVAIHSYASNAENVLYIPWGPNTEDETLSFVDLAIQKSKETPTKDFYFAAIRKDTGKLIGDCELRACDHQAALGWILHRDDWRRGYGTELGEALLKFGFETLNLHRIFAKCDAENHASYRLMEKLGMRREGLSIASRQANRLSSEPYRDELLYAITKDEWDILPEIAHYNALPCEFDDFIDVPMLSDGKIYLVCMAKKPAIPEKKYVPAYIFAVCAGGEKIGEIGLRVGYTDGLYYGGQIGYGIDEKHRGNGYAASACRLLQPVAKAHGMQKLLITNASFNDASRRVCEKLSARLVRVARVPEWNELYQNNVRFVNIFEWTVE